MSDASHLQHAGPPPVHPAVPSQMMGQLASAIDRRAGMRRRHRTAADELRERWWAAARPGWRGQTPWWTDAIDTLTRAVADGRDPLPAVTQFGQERARAMVGLAQSLDDLSIFWRLSGGTVAGPTVVRAAVAGWRSVADSRPGAGGPPPCWRGQHLTTSHELCPASCDAMVL